MKQSNVDLYTAVILTFLALVFILLPPFNQTPLRVIFSLPLLFFIPGYVAMQALFPRKETLDVAELALFSFGLSLAIVSLIGFALNFTKYGIALVPTIAVLYVFILLAGGACIVRRRSLKS
jgi:uncharacterized membrane protein